VASLNDLTAWNQNLADDESRAWWRAYVGRQSIAAGDTVLIRLGVQPKESTTLVTRLNELLDASGISPAERVISPGLGTVLLRIRGDGLTADGLASFQHENAEHVTTTTVLQAPAALKAGLDVWGRAPETVSVMRALKQEFDPAGTLNPGRYVDRI
jgi:glycolate oxidase FAD binding subunit